MGGNQTNRPWRLNHQVDGGLSSLHHEQPARCTEGTTADQVGACSALDVHIAVENVVQGFVGQLHSDIRVRNLETSYRTLRDSSSRAMVAVPSDLVGCSLVEGRSEWKDKTFGTMEHFCCRELDLGIGVVGLHQPCGNTSLHAHCCCCHWWWWCCGCIDRQVQHYV